MTVNAAWPAAKEIAVGARPANSTANGSSTHSTVVLVPISATSAPPTTNPAVVPSRPRIAFWPVLSALERSTASVPNTTQKPCWTEVSSATSTASARPVAPRRLLCSHDELGSACASARSRAELSGPVKPAGWRPSSRSSQLRRAGGSGELDVGGDLLGDVGELLGAEARDRAPRRSRWRRRGRCRPAAGPAGKLVVCSSSSCSAERSWSRAAVSSPGRRRTLGRAPTRRSRARRRRRA